MMLLATLRRRRIAMVDLTDAFVQPGHDAAVDEWFMSGGHYSRLGNRQVASTLGRHMEEMMEAGGRASP